MFIKEKKVLDYVREIGFVPQENATISAKIQPYELSTTVTKVMKALSGSNEFSILHFAENEIVIIPISWWTMGMKKKEHWTIPYSAIKNCSELEAGGISYKLKIETVGEVFEVIISDKSLTEAKLTGGALLDGDWHTRSLPGILEKLQGFGK